LYTKAANCFAWFDRWRWSGVCFRNY